eukprot:13542728-Alexandrium_andersonii.AAC.1
MSPTRSGPHRRLASASERSASAPHSTSAGPWPGGAAAGWPGTGPEDGPGWPDGAVCGAADPDSCC